MCVCPYMYTYVYMHAHTYACIHLFKLYTCIYIFKRYILITNGTLIIDGTYLYASPAWFFLKAGCSDTSGWLQAESEPEETWVCTGPVSGLRQTEELKPPRERDGLLVLRQKGCTSQRPGYRLLSHELIFLNNIFVGDRDSKVAMRNSISSSFPIFLEKPRSRRKHGREDVWFPRGARQFQMGKPSR